MGVKNWNPGSKTTNKNTNGPGDKEWPRVGMVLAIKGESDLFLVKDSRWWGGGTGHGPGDVYPDGWRVRCVSLVDNNRGIEFYRRDTGCFRDEFTLPIEDITELKSYPYPGGLRIVSKSELEKVKDEIDLIPISELPEDLGESDWLLWNGSYVWNSPACEVRNALDATHFVKFNRPKS